jgi:hypothetical protein
MASTRVVAVRNAALAAISLRTLISQAGTMIARRPRASMRNRPPRSTVTSHHDLWPMVAAVVKRDIPSEQAWETRST